jgi:hypothetical protein
MSVDQLASRLDDRFRLLTSGSRTALPRHKTLRAVVDWSWELLTDAERMVLRRLSVFSGGASLEAAERVCAGGAVEPDQVLELLTALAEKSLLLAAGDSAPRYRMTGTIKEYAGHRLAEAGESDLARHAHLGYFTELTETADPHLRRAGQLEWLATLEAEHDNIGSAMRGALTAGEAHAAMRLAAGAGWYWWLAGHRTEGIELTELADQIAIRGEFAAACEHYEQAIAAVTEVGAVEEVIPMRSRQAQLYWLLGDGDSSAAAMAEAQRYADRVTWPDALAELALSKAELARWGGHAGEAYQQLGVVATMLGDAADQANIRAVTPDLLGYLADDLREARTHRVAAWQAASEAGHAPLIAKTLVGVADLAVRLDQYEQAARLLAASTGVRGLPDRSHPDAARIERETPWPVSTAPRETSMTRNRLMIPVVMSEFTSVAVAPSP